RRMSPHYRPSYTVSATRPSSPTPRSSDLTGHVTEAERFGWSFVFDAFVEGEALHHLLPGHVPGTPWWRGVHGATWTAPTGPGSSDRKSTRLNSSHVSTSYDVFCLTKNISR